MIISLRMLRVYSAHFEVFADNTVSPDRLPWPLPLPLAETADTCPGDCTAAWEVVCPSACDRAMVVEVLCSVGRQRPSARHEHSVFVAQ